MCEMNMDPSMSKQLTEPRLSFDKHIKTDLEQEVAMLKQDFRAASTQNERMQSKNENMKLELTLVRRQLNQL